MGGEIQETSKKNIIRAVTAQDMLQEVNKTIKGSAVIVNVVFVN